jgi:hypothetical protein
MTSSVPQLAHPTRSVPRLVRPPCTEPPYDDEIGVSAWETRPSPDVTQGTLALTFTLPSGLPARPQPATRLRLVDGPSAGQTNASGPQQARASGSPQTRMPSERALPDAQAWAGTLAQAVVEVLAGDRPVAQLLRWTSARIYAEMSRRAALAARECTAVRCGRSRAVVRRVRVSHPVEGVAEASAIVSDGTRTRAMALRLQHADGRWLCTALELG